MEIFCSSPVSTIETAEAGCKQLDGKKVDLLIIALAPYCPSGVLAPVLEKLQVPVLLWPVQSMYELKPEEYDREVMMLNHGVHAVQDLANVLGKTDKLFGVAHGHLNQTDFKERINSWVRAGRAIISMRKANPVQIGGHFEDMLDLQIGDEKFIQSLEIKTEVIKLNEFSKLLKTVDENKINEYVQSYREQFDINDDINQKLLEKTARGHYALDKIMQKYNSFACGLNFLDLCNDDRIGDALHVAASVLMSRGGGYAGEGDWVTATFLYGMQQALGVASFSEIFSVGYGDNRLVLKHWGEGNFKMSRSRPMLFRSGLPDKYKSEFVSVDFEFDPGPACLININCNREGQGQLISIKGTITEDHLTKTDGPRAVFKPDAQDVRELLNNYAYHGGSHHLTLVKGDCTKVLECISRLSGWLYFRL